MTEATGKEQLEGARSAEDPSADALEDLDAPEDTAGQTTGGDGGTTQLIRIALVDPDAPFI